MAEYKTEEALLERVNHQMEAGVRVPALYRLKAYLEDRMKLPRSSHS